MFESPVVSVHIPLALRCHTGGAEEVTVSGDTVGDAFSALDHEHPGVLGRVLEPGSAAPRAGYRIFLGSQNIMVLQGLDTPIGTEEVVSIVAPAGLSN
ncbi:MAG: hypothetical protein KA603_09350 [Azonexus sp.]|nr:molybdopterin synthase sulfur carrier subunit [Betaproteobacteria bacterium]MBK8919556.1 molybdopterin synthase sulfur carrier subunit [Betaproteobacteria bacterium]MBP6036324.1 hypothetical protein [Azonexus sp.]MBP6906812.1 hypothetical protein [Azonexus sp.]